MLAAQSLLKALSCLQDPRARRGVRHPFAGMVVLMLLGMLARIREMEVLVRWATVHWDQLREALGFDRDQPPCATTVSRTLAQCRVTDFQAAWAAWLRTFVTETSPGGTAVRSWPGLFAANRSQSGRYPGRVAELLFPVGDAAASRGNNQ